MRVITRTLLLLAAAAVMAGCAATGPLYSDVAARIPPLATDQGRIYFMRADTLFGAAITADIHLNGDVVGKSERGSFFYVDRRPGNYTVATSTETEKQLTFTLAARETKYVRTSVSMGLLVGRIAPQLVSPSVAKTEIANLHYTGTPLARR